MVWNTDGYERDRVDGMSAETVRIDEAIDYLQHQTLEQLAQNKYIGKNRAPVMVAATVIFKEIYDTLQIKVLTSSLKGAQDAIIEDLRQKWQS
jgi:exopolyphosphatase/pppGpp-phosphohydrolase